MIIAYRSNGESMMLPVDQQLQTLPADVIWLDLAHPTREEDHYAQHLTGIEVPTREDLRDIEPSSRLYSEGRAHYMTASLLCHADTATPKLADIAFVLTDRHLVTVRYDEPKSFKLYAAALGRSTNVPSAPHVTLVKLMETISDRTAEILEQAEMKGEALLLAIFGDGNEPVKRRPPRFLENLLSSIGHHHRLISKARDSMASLSRLMSFLTSVQTVQSDAEAKAVCLSVTRDLQTLSEHAAFISSNTTFLLDASLGLINVEQNAIIKIFSIASVVLLPPTLVASIYGMNFRFMPELEWTWGYPAAIMMMIVSAVIPFFFFRWKGWL
jgi:magnesium transporter